MLGTAVIVERPPRSVTFQEKCFKSYERVDTFLGFV